MSDDLVERVALAFCGKDVPCKMCRNDAKKAIAAALEEAARVCEDELVGSFDQYSEGYNDGCKESAAAIRAMIPSGTALAQDDTGSAE
jgi:hypothetical protein